MMFRALALLLLAAPAAAQDRFSPSDLDPLAVSAPTEVMVLGTPHLSAAPDDFTTDMLEPVLQRLEAFAPTHIAIEAVSGEHARFLAAEAARYPGVAEQFAGTALRLSGLAGETVALTPGEAESEAAGLAGTAMTPARANRAAASRCPAGDPWSALVHWLQIPEGARTAGGPVGEELAAALDRLAASRNESAAIGAVLAARLGHDRVWPMDDWTAGDLFLSVVPRLQAAIESDPALQGVMSDPAMAETQAAYRRLTSPEEVLEVYRLFNEPRAQPARAAAEWGAFLRAAGDAEAARARVVAWEARNLRMAAHILEATRGMPGARVLVIVGASHKPYLEAALDDLALVDIVEFE